MVYGLGGWRLGGARLILDEVEGSTTLDCRESGLEGYGAAPARRTVAIVSIRVVSGRGGFDRQGRQGSPRECGKELNRDGTTEEKKNVRTLIFANRR
jgi:hypothetical protein